MKVNVDTDVCIGFGNCEETCPKVFKVIGGISHVQVDEVEAQDQDCVRSAAKKCPSGALTYEE